MGGWWVGGGGGWVFFFNDTATTEIYTLSLHDALPIYAVGEHTPCHGQFHSAVRNFLKIGRDSPIFLVRGTKTDVRAARMSLVDKFIGRNKTGSRSEEHTSELQSPDHLVCRLLLEKKKHKKKQKLC